MEEPAPYQADWIDAREACDLLEVKRSTLYSYVSRGLVRSRPGPGRARRYSRADIQRLLRRRDARRGHGAVAADALRWGQPVLETAIGTIDPEGPRYRTTLAVDLAEDGASLEGVGALLWQRPWRPPPRRTMPRIPARLSEPAERLAYVLLLLDVEERSREVPLESILTRAVASLALDPRDAQAAMRAPRLGHGLLAAFGVRPSLRRVRMVERALVLAADHELNASTFVARIVASTGASTCACLGAALAALSGPAHGRASDRLEERLHQVARPEAASPQLREVRSRGEALPGFGHPLYPQGDPRGRALLASCTSRRPRRTLRVLRSVVASAEDLGLGRPNLDAGLVAVRAEVGLPVGAAFALFAIGRMVGWIAHIREQRSQGGLLRPRARFIG